MHEGRLGELQTFIVMLTFQTREGAVKWGWQRRLEEGRCVAELANGRVLVEKDFGNDTLVTIQDSDSNTLEKINVGFPEYADLKPYADELYDLARRSALQVDTKLESIFNEIAGRSSL